MSAAIEIRSPMAKDKSDWARLWEDYLAFYETLVSDHVQAATFASFFSDDPHAPRCLLALQEGKVAGLVHFLFHAHCWRPEGICYLQDLFVDPAARKGGIGGALIQAVYHAADARGVPNVYWTTQTFNHTARRLYDQIGAATPFMKYVRVT